MSAGPPRSTTPRPGPLRARIEGSSRAMLVRLHALPRVVVPAATVVLFAVGALSPVSIALVALAVTFGFMAWIAYLSWPVVPASGRLLRVAMLALIVVLAVSRV